MRFSLIATSILTANTFVVTAAGIVRRAAPAQCTAGYRTISRRLCNFQCGIDRVGGDIGPIQTGNLTGCAQACAADYRCTTAQFNEGTGFCYLKNTRNPSSTNAGVDTVDCEPSGVSTTPTPTPTPTPCAAGTRVINGRTCVVSCGIDRPGSDYFTSQTNSIEACIQACAGDPRCVTAQYHESNRFCYFKNAKNNAVSAAGDDTVDCGPAPTTTTTTTTTTATATPTGSPACDPSHPYSAPNGKQYNEVCSSYYGQGESYDVLIDSTITANLTACIDLCSTTTNCRFVDWVKSPVAHNYRKCYLIYTNALGSTLSNNYDSAHLVGL